MSGSDVARSFFTLGDSLFFLFFGSNVIWLIVQEFSFDDIHRAVEFSLIGRDSLVMEF